MSEIETTVAAEPAPQIVVTEDGATFGPFASIELLQETVHDENTQQDRIVETVVCDGGRVLLPVDALGPYQVLPAPDPATRVYSQEELQPLKDAKNAAINAARLKANTTSFTFLGKEIACDELSAKDIDGTNGCVLLTGSFPPGWPGGWKAIDNSYVQINTLDDWKSFYLSMCSYGAQNFARAQQLKAEVEQATTPEAIAAVSWNAAPSP